MAWLPDSSTPSPHPQPQIQWTYCLWNQIPNSHVKSSSMWLHLTCLFLYSTTHHQTFIPTFNLEQLLCPSEVHGFFLGPHLWLCSPALWHAHPTMWRSFMTHFFLEDNYSRLLPLCFPLIFLSIPHIIINSWAINYSLLLTGEVWATRYIASSLRTGLTLCFLFVS